MFLSSEYLAYSRPLGAPAFKADNVSSLTPKPHNYGGPNAMPTHQLRYQKGLLRLAEKDHRFWIKRPPFGFANQKSIIFSAVMLSASKAIKVSADFTRPCAIVAQDSVFPDPTAFLCLILNTESVKLSHIGSYLTPPTRYAIHSPSLFSFVIFEYSIVPCPTLDLTEYNNRQIWPWR